MKAIILAAGRGSRLKGFTEDKPKCLNIVGKSPLLEHQKKALTEAGAESITVVTGYKDKMLKGLTDAAINNPRWSETNMVSSLLCAKSSFDESLIVSYSDIVYSSETAEKLIHSDSDCVIVYDTDWKKQWKLRFDNPLDDAESFKIDKEGFITDIGNNITKLDETDGQYIGLLKFSPKAFSWITAYTSNLSSDEVDKLDMTTLIMGLIKNGHKIKGLPITGQWFEVDTVKDLEIANNLYIEGKLSFLR